MSRPRTPLGLATLMPPTAIVAAKADDPASDSTMHQVSFDDTNVATSRS